MSSDFFRVKKGLNIQPTDPSGLSDLQDGDIVIDSTAGNSMKIYSTDAGGFSEVGTGSGINYIDNNSFDGGVSGWTGDTNLVISKEDVAPLRGTGSLKIAKAAVFPSLMDFRAPPTPVISPAANISSMLVSIPSSTLMIQPPFAAE